MSYRSWLWVALPVLSLNFYVMPMAWAAEGTVEAVGEALIKNNDTVAAKKEATADALKKCIEQVVGISIKSDFSSEQQETVKNNQNEFYSKVKDQLVQQSEGFIQKHEVLEENVAGSTMKVKVRATVFESKVKAEVKKLADLIAAAGNPKLMLVIQEVYISKEGKKRVAKESILGAQLEKELLARGFEIRGQKEAKNVADDDVSTYDKWLDNVGGVAQMARDAGADVLIAGRVEAYDKGPIEDTGGLDALKGQTRVEINSVIRGLNAATAEVFSTKPTVMSSVGVNLERAMNRAFAGRGANLVKQTFDDLLADLKESFKKTAEQGQFYVIALKGVTSFRNQGQKFMQMLEKVEGISSVKQKSFESGNLVLDVACKCSTSELQNRIFSSSSGIKEFGGLDVDGVSGKRLAFKL